MDGSSIPVKVPSLSVEAVSRTFPCGTMALRPLSFSVFPGQSLAVVGGSGSGKTTLLNLLAGFDTPSSGDISLAGRRLATLAPSQLDAFRVAHLGFVHQHHRLLPDMTLCDNVALPARLAGRPKKVARAMAMTLLERVGLAPRAHAFPGCLSGGERQRGGVARALVNAPRVLLADEPTGNLDPETSARVWALMEDLAREQGSALVVVTHAPHLASRLDRTLRLDGSA